MLEEVKSNFKQKSSNQDDQKMLEEVKSSFKQKSSNEQSAPIFEVEIDSQKRMKINNKQNKNRKQHKKIEKPPEVQLVRKNKLKKRKREQQW